MDNNIKKQIVKPYTEIGGPYRNEAYQNPKYVEEYKKEQEKAKKEAEKKAKKETKEQDQGQEM